MKREQNVRFAIVVVVLVVAAAIVHGRAQLERVPMPPPLSSLPAIAGEWQSTTLPITDNVRETLGQGDFLARRYTKQDDVAVDLFIGYFPTQRTGQTIHSPKNCLPGGGWTPLQADRMDMNLTGRPLLVVNRYVLGKDSSRELVVYWYQAHSRVVASEYWAKVYLIWDAMLLNRTDGALVRLSTPVLEGEQLSQAEKRVQALAQIIVPELDTYIPR